jgi:hypothetical protein
MTKLKESTKKSWENLTQCWTKLPKTQQSSQKSKPKSRKPRNPAKNDPIISEYQLIFIQMKNL